MALIKCSECGKEISDKAETCPSCGNPINKTPEVNKTVEIEQTNKKWKKRRIWGLIFLFGGLIVMSQSLGLGILLIFIAIIIGITANVGAWWTNG